MAERFTIAEITFYPWRAGQIGEELAERGIRVSAFPRSDSRMISASQRLPDAITEGRLVHPDDARLDAHVAAAVARHGRRGWRCADGGRSDIALEVHNVNGDPTDNRIANCRPLCRDCHHEATFPGS